jgi:hypothetical protein
MYKSRTVKVVSNCAHVVTTGKRIEFSIVRTIVIDLHPSLGCIWETAVYQVSPSLCARTSESMADCLTVVVPYRYVVSVGSRQRRTLFCWVMEMRSVSGLRSGAVRFLLCLLSVLDTSACTSCAR